MKKILFIDDEKESISELEKEILKITHIEQNYIDFAFSIYDFFEPIDSGKSVKIASNLDDYAFIFIHKSINDIRIPETIFSAIINKVGKNKLFIFSGGSGNVIKERKFNREKLYNKIPSFVEFCSKYGDWYIPVLYFEDYRKKYANKLIEEIRVLKSISALGENIQYKKLEALLDLNGRVYEKYETINQFINEILNKIENE